MPVSEEYLQFILDQLRQVTPVSSRRMFGGAGFYAGNLFFAVADDDVLFLKTDETTVARYAEEGMAAFQPLGPGTPPMGYHELPARVLEDVDELRVFVIEAIEAARRAKAKKKPRAVRAPTPGPRPRRRRGGP